MPVARRGARTSRWPPTEVACENVATAQLHQAALATGAPKSSMRGTIQNAGARLGLALVCLLAAGCSPALAALQEAAPLLAFKQSVSAGAADSLPDWTTGTDPCSAAAPWAGVGCTAGRVTSILLSDSGLAGSLPPALNLSQLAVIDLNSNQLEGSLPPSLAIPSLQRLLLEGNQLTGSLPASWAAGFPALRELTLQGNKLTGTVPAAWLAPAGFSPPFTAALQPGNPLLCGGVAVAPNHTLLYSGPSGNEGNASAPRVEHAITATLGSCAQDGNCGGAVVNVSAPNLYDLAWANGVAPLDLEAFNPAVQQNGEPKQGSPVVLPCYPADPPTFFGSDAARGKATWQSGTVGSRASWLPVSGNRRARLADECSMTADAPGYWVVDLQRETSVLGVLVRAGPQQMERVEIRVGSQPAAGDGALCRGPDSYDPGEGKIVLCTRALTGRYVSISASTRVALCAVEVLPAVGNAALGKPTSASAGTGDSTQASQVVNGNVANTACATVVSGSDLGAWISVDLGYEAAVEAVVVQNGYSTFANDLYVRLGNTPVVVGTENPVCSQGQTLPMRAALPIQCTGPDGGPAVGRYLTLYRKTNQASDMYICQVMAFLAVGPAKFAQSMPTPPPPPLSPPPAPPPPAPRGTVDISVGAATTVMGVSLELSGPGLSPLDGSLQDRVVAAAAAAWEGNFDMRRVRGLAFTLLDPLDGQAVAPEGAVAPRSADGAGRRLRQAGNATARLAAQLGVDVAAGQAPNAALFIQEAGWPGGSLQGELASEGLEGVVPTTLAIRDLGAPPPPPPYAEPPALTPAPAPEPSPPAEGVNEAQTSSSGGSVPVGAVVGGVVGGLAAAAAVAAGLLLARRRRQRVARLAGGDDSGSDSPKALGAMERGHGADLLGLPKAAGGEAGGYSLTVATALGGGDAYGSAKLELDGEHATRGPPPDIITFLADDQRSDHSAMTAQPSEAADGGASGAAAAPVASGALAGASSVARTSSDGGLSHLQKQRSVASRYDSGVSELWTVAFGELDLQKQIGEGSFGKVYLAKWRETTVAVKVLGAMGSASAPGLDDEFPDAAAAASKRHPLHESLQKEAAMMASLRHPSIVMYLGVCLDPPAVVTEYCARGSLADVLKRARTSPPLAAQLDWARRLNMALDAAKGMLYLHSCSPPIIHRDLKSANLLVDRHWRVRVCDFNLSRVLEDSAVLSSVAATNPRWLAPEILSGKGYTFASDVYSFGICMWELLTWQVPYHEYGPWQVVAMVTENSKRPEVPDPEDLPSPGFGGGGEYAALMQQCWAQDPADRPDFAAVISRLRRMLAVEAGLRRDSPTKAPRGLAPLATRATSGSLGGGGGDDTPVSRSRQASLHGGSDLCLSPEPVLSASPSEPDTLVLSAAASVASGAGAGGGSPPRPVRPTVGSAAQQPAPHQPPSIPGGLAGAPDEALAAAAATADGSMPPGG